MLRYNSIKFSRRFINGQLNNELNLLHFISLDLFQELNFHVNSPNISVPTTRENLKPIQKKKKNIEKNTPSNKSKT